LAADLGINDETAVIGYIGTFVDYEGLEDLVSAAAIVRRTHSNFKILLVGAESVVETSLGPVTRKINETVEKEGLKDHIILAGRVPHSEVERYYSLIDIAPFPRKPWRVCEMVSPMKPLEAMAMKKAVIVSSVQALAEMVQHEVTGLVFEKANIESLAETIIRLIGDRKLRAQLGENAREWVKNERTWEYSTKEIVDKLDLHAAQAPV
jgi:glycosyltransferase involved in cell wall biosynthesis